MIRSAFKRGFTFIEVLVALLVLSIGLVGIASLQLTGLKNAHSSYYTSIASSVALDFEERLWLAADKAAPGCLTESDIVGADGEGGIIAELQAQWGSGDAGTVSIPGLQVTVPQGGFTNFADTRVEAKIIISWSDGRFEGDSEDTPLEGDSEDTPLEESFPYTARVICAVPPAP